MANVGEALSALGITEWVLRGEPTTEEEFNDMFRKVTGSTADGSAIESSNTSDFGTTCLLYTSPSPRDRQKSRMPSSA